MYFFFFDKLKFHAALHRASLSTPFFNQDLLTSFLCVIFSCKTVNLINKLSSDCSTNGLFLAPLPVSSWASSMP